MEEIEKNFLNKNFDESLKQVIEMLYEINNLEKDGKEYENNIDNLIKKKGKKKVETEYQEKEKSLIAILVQVYYEKKELEKSKNIIFQYYGDIYETPIELIKIQFYFF
jgi:ABC-type enterochelin transport system substrate-binding protein